MPDSRLSFGTSVNSNGRIMWRSVWNSGSAYQLNDLVSWTGGVYIALQASTNVLPSNTLFWDLVIAGGSVTSVASRTGSVVLVSSDLSDHDTALGVPLLDSNAFLKAAQENTSLNSQVGTSYTIVATDRGKLLTLSNASPVAVTVPAASGSFAAGFFLEVTNVGAGLVTLTPTGTIDGAASLTLSQFQSITLTSVGGNWICLRSKAVFDSTTGTGSVVLSASPTITGTLSLNAVKQVAGSSLSIADPLGVSHFFISNASPYTNSFVNGNGAGVVFLGAAAKTSVADTTGNIVTAGNLTLQTGTGTLPATVANDGSGGVQITSNGVAGLTLANTGAVIINSPGAVVQFRGATSGTTNVQAAAVAGAGTLTLPGGVTDTLVGKATTDTLSNKTLSGTTPFNRMRANQGTALVTGDVSAITNFGTTATCSVVTGTDSGGTISISSSGTGQIANGTFTLTFHDGAWPAAPVVLVSRGDGNGPGSASVACSSTTTSITFSFNGVAVAGSTYIFNFICIGRP